MVTASRGQLCLVGGKKRKSPLRTSLWHAGDMTASPCVNQLLLRYIHVSMATLQRRLCLAVRKRRREEQRAEPAGAGRDARLRGRASWSSATSEGRLRGCHDEIQPPFKARTAAELISSSYAAVDGPVRRRHFGGRLPPFISVSFSSLC